jgi:hypothetical protein
MPFREGGERMMRNVENWIQKVLHSWKSQESTTGQKISLYSSSIEGSFQRETQLHVDGMVVMVASTTRDAEVLWRRICDFSTANTSGTRELYYSITNDRRSRPPHPIIPQTPFPPSRKDVDAINSSQPHPHSIQSQPVALRLHLPILPSPPWRTA